MEYNSPAARNAAQWERSTCPRFDVLGPPTVLTALVHEGRRHIRALLAEPAQQQLDEHALALVLAEIGGFDRDGLARLSYQELAAEIVKRCSRS